MKDCLINPKTKRAVRADSDIGKKISGNKFANLLKTRNQLSALAMEAEMKQKKPSLVTVKPSLVTPKKRGRPKKVKTYAEVLATPVATAPKKRGRPKKVKTYADVVAKPAPRPRGRPKKVL